jgi:hypothetical protein
MLEAMVQYAMRIGIEVKRAKKSVVKRPPPTFLAMYHGITVRMKKRRTFEKLSLPGPSAGRGAFLMAGYCNMSLVRCIKEIDISQLNIAWELTEVVRTPQSWAVSSDVGAGGVSMNSNESSDMAFSCSLMTTKFKDS